MTISIVIPAYNEEKYIGKCLESILQHDCPELLEVILVDNGCSDRTISIAKQFEHHKVHLVCELTKGPNFARQLGYKIAKGEIVATIDSDTVIPDGWFEAMLRAFKDPKTVGISGPYDYYDLPLWQRKTLYWTWKYIGLVSAKIAGFVVYGGNFAGRKSSLEKIGGFDENIVFYGDDANTGKRLHAIGRVRFVPGFRILTSARRLKAEGILRICWIYTINFLSIAIRGKTFTMSHRDFR